MAKPVPAATTQPRCAAEHEYVQRFAAPTTAHHAACDTRDAIDMLDDSYRAYTAVEILTSTASTDSAATQLDDLDRDNLGALLRVLNRHLGQHLHAAKQQAQRSVEQCS